MQKELHALMAQQSPDALVAADVDGRVLGWNPAAQALFGYALEQALGSTLDALVTPPGEDTLAALVATLAPGRSQQSERLCRRADGSLIQVLCTMRLTEPADGGAHVHCAMTDVTPLRVQRDRQLVAARYRGLLELAPDAIVIVNDMGRIVLFNARARALFGHDEAAVLGAPVEVLLPERLQHGHVRHRNAYLAAPRMRDMGAGLELAGVRADGTEFPVEISLSPIESDIGRLVMSAIRDTTERKRIERALQDQNVELERANRAKDSFLAGMSHELRTPLNAILGFTGLMLMQLPGPLTDAQRRQLELVQSSGKHLLSLINDLLDMAKIDAGRIDLMIEPVAAQPLIDGVAATLRPNAEAKGLRLEIDLPEEPLLVLADKRALQQILLNLASNAVKFTGSGRVVLRLVAGDATAGDGMPRIEVEDTGVGIAEADQMRLFEAFRQVGTPRAAGQEGTGLGLHLSRRLAALMHGRIDVRSRAGKGSVFTLHLPVATATPPPAR